MTDRSFAMLIGCLLLAAAMPGCTEPPSKQASAGPTTGPAPALTFPAGKDVSLFDGKTLAGWKAPKFYKEGKVWLKNGEIHIGIGDGITGLVWTGPVLREDYELSLKARRVDGDDFFCGLTFPIGKDAATLILGGWGGELVGLSCIDTYDASENSTTQSMKFEKNKWYDVRVRVTVARITCYVNDEEIINVEREGRKFSVRWEVENCVPLGLATWKTHGAIKDVCLRKLINAEKDPPVFGE